MLENIKRNDKSLLIFLIFYRTINSLLLLTMFEPDEFFQNIEPITFLLSKKNELSWDFLCGIRSINFSLLYYLPLFIGYKLNSITLTYLLVKFMNGILSGLNDFFTIKIGNFYHTDVFFITLIHHGLWLYSPRSHINSFEMLICTSTMYFLESFKRHNQKKEIFTNFYYLRLFLYFTLIGSFLRPSACLMSLLPFLQCVIKNNLFYKLFSFVPELILLLSALIFNDYLFYKEVVLVPFNFVKYNVFYKVQELFGVLPFYIYFPFGLVLLGPSFFYFFLHFKKNILSLSVLFFFTFYSSLSHKEMRFLIPMIPFVNILVSKNKKLKYYFYYPAFIIGIIAGLFHQNIFSTLYLLKREIDSGDEQKNILFLTEPYIFPSFVLLSDKKVSVKLLSGNPNIFEKISDPKIYKRFNQQLVVKENHKVIDQIVRNEFLFDEFNLLVLSNFFYDLVKENISDEFMLLGVKKYYLVDLPGLPNNKFYIFKRIK